MDVVPAEQTSEHYIDAPNGAPNTNRSVTYKKRKVTNQIKRGRNIQKTGTWIEIGIEPRKNLNSHRHSATRLTVQRPAFDTLHKEGHDRVFRGTGEPVNAIMVCNGRQRLLDGVQALGKIIDVLQEANKILRCTLPDTQPMIWTVIFPTSPANLVLTTKQKDNREKNSQGEKDILTDLRVEGAIEFEAEANAAVMFWEWVAIL